MLVIREWKIDNEMHAAKKRLVDILPEIGRQNRYPFILLHLLQEITDLDIRVAIVRILYLRPLAEQGIGFVEEQDGVRGLCLHKNLVEVLLGLADILADNLRKVDPVEIKLQFTADHLGRHGLARSGRTGKKRIQSFAKGKGAVKTPIAVDAVPIARSFAELLELRQIISREHNLVPCVFWLDFLREQAQLWA